MPTLYYCTNRAQLGTYKTDGPLEKTPDGYYSDKDDQVSDSIDFGEIGYRKSGSKITWQAPNIIHSSKLLPRLGDWFRNQKNRDQQQICIYVHGFNVSFDDAVVAAAQLQEELKKRGYQGLMALFTWPSDGKLTHYFSDQVDAERSSTAFLRALMKVKNFIDNTFAGDPSQVCSARIHLVAHSMGNLLLQDAMFNLWNYSGRRPHHRMLNEVVMAAADIANEALEPGEMGEAIPAMASRVTVYYAEDDLSMPASKVANVAHLRFSRRLGQFGPEHPERLPQNVWAVDCSKPNKGFLGHSYYLESKDILDDLASVLAGGPGSKKRKPKDGPRSFEMT